jgi:hypothetical protein
MLPRGYGSLCIFHLVFIQSLGSGITIFGLHHTMTGWVSGENSKPVLQSRIQTDKKLNMLKKEQYHD